MVTILTNSDEQVALHKVTAQNVLNKCNPFNIYTHMYAHTRTNTDTARQFVFFFVSTLFVSWDKE